MVPPLQELCIEIMEQHHPLGFHLLVYSVSKQTFLKQDWVELVS